MNTNAMKTFIRSMNREYGVPQSICGAAHAHRMTFFSAEAVSGDAPRADSVFWIYSATKVLTAAAAMRLVQDGKLRPDDPVSRYLPEYASLRVKDGTAAKTALTVRHLMTMQGGYDYSVKTRAVRALIARDGDASTRDVVRAFAEKELLFEPGTHFYYSLCLDILGAVMEVASGCTLGEWLRACLLDPLGMRDTGFAPTPEILSRMVPQFRMDADGHIQPIDSTCFCRVTPRYESAGGGLYSTLKDLMTFADAMACGGVTADGRELLSREMLDCMRTNALGSASLADYRQRYTRPGYGYGLGVRTGLDGTRSAGVFGWDGAAGAHVMIDPERQQSLIYLQHVHGMDFLYDNEFRSMDEIMRDN